MAQDNEDYPIYKLNLGNWQVPKPTVTPNPYYGQPPCTKEERAVIDAATAYRATNLDCWAEPMREGEDINSADYQERIVKLHFAESDARDKVFAAVDEVLKARGE